MLELHGLALEHFLHQVIGNVMIVTTERGDEGMAVGIILHGACRHLQAGNPAFATAFSLFSQVKSTHEGIYLLTQRRL